MSDQTPFEVSGTYLESCNCAVVCPCRTIGGQKGGRSTEGICTGALSWAIEKGQAGGLDLSGLGVVMAIRYDDDEPGSPWRFFLYLDERASGNQHEMLEDIWLGRLGGTPHQHFPWVWKPSDMLDVRSVSIEIDHTPGKGFFRAGRHVTMRVREPLAAQESVTCVIPGHDRGGRELYADVLAVDDGPLDFELSGKCAYESTFSYASDPAA